MQKLLLAIIFALSFAQVSFSQDLQIATVTRPPFSLVENGNQTGFSIDLWDALAKDLGRDYSIVRVDSFTDMLGMAKEAQVDAAVANISITSQRESEMDFTHPIFESGLQILTHSDRSNNSGLVAAIFSRDLLLAILLAFALLLGGGMLMLRFERNDQTYFEQPARQALFPAFWWALNLVVNGGFEERVPRTFLGRVLGVFLVISSLFIVSVFVAKITTVMTVHAITNSVNSINDLYDKSVGTIESSTASLYLDGRELRHQTYPNLDLMFADFEDGNLDAIVFDSPILAFYAKNSDGKALLAGPVFLRENYGIALPSDSALKEPLNRALLKFRENGTYERIYRKWFGQSSGR